MQIDPSQVIVDSWLGTIRPFAKLGLAIDQINWRLNWIIGVFAASVVAGLGMYGSLGNLPTTNSS